LSPGQAYTPEVRRLDILVLDDLLSARLRCCGGASFCFTLGYSR
jgi:hypothetical protein